ncbi:MAG: hypothetical protein KTR14_10770 [Vampirovibrio sp.]|nr:hypothetical protein [Vampirovibrio sp.]
MVISVIFMVVLLAFLGLAIYTGLNAYLQNELQKAASTAALAGASSYYDDVNAQGAPQKNAANALTAAQQTWNRMTVNNGALANFGATATSGPNALAGSETVSLETQAVVPTPFLAPVGVNSLTVTANAIAKNVLYTLQNPVSIDPLTGANGGGTAWMQNVLLDHPLVDGPGADMVIFPAVFGGGTHGYMVEACSGNQCVDVSHAARLLGNGSILERDYGDGTSRWVIYGPVSIDLGAAGGLGYNANMKKATSLKIVDDGIPDMFFGAGDRRLILSNAQPNQINFIKINHHAVTCSGINACGNFPGLENGNTLMNGVQFPN